MRLVGHQQVLVLVEHHFIERNHRLGGQVAVVIQAQAALKRPLGGDAHAVLIDHIARLDAAPPVGTATGRQTPR